MGNLGDLSPEGSVAVGVVVGLISTSLQAIGLTLQRKSHILEDEKHPYDLRRPPYKRRRWQLGMLMFVVANIVGSTIQITTLPLPVLSTLQASGLVFNTIFATLILGEPFTRYSLVGTGLVCVGALLIAIFGAVGEPAHTLDQLLELLQRRNFVLWMVGTAVMVLVIYLGSRLLRFLASPSRSKYGNPRGSYMPHLQLSHGRVRLMRGLSYGMISGILSAHSLLLAKSAVELLVRTVVDRVNQFNRWQSWVILLAMIALALSQLFYLHRGLKLCSTSVLYPFVFCIYNIIAIIDGLIYFQQMSQLTGFHAGLISLGTIVLLGGVLCLSWRLEVIDSHAAVTVGGPSQTGLGPGMAVVEEHPTSPLGLGMDGEEDLEREPLLQAAHPSRMSPHKRAPSLPLLYPTGSQRDSTDLDSASIWAELDDSDYDYVTATLRSQQNPRGSLSNRPRSRTGAVTLRDNLLRGPRRSSTIPVNQGSWNQRRAPYGISERRKQRRTSAPAPEYRRLLLKRPTLPGLSSDPNQPRITGYGTQDDRSDNVFSGNNRRHPSDFSTHTDPSDGYSHSSLLAGPRRTLRGAWRGSLRYLTRWTGGQARASRATADPDPGSDPDLDLEASPDRPPD
ncbi:hypothetical protein BO70DRAFT_428808 [Aspergillus heteromorphus CBS 117.55]|uniref:DUF803 domain protein n=1 Tax=Aspergillus heteromorphus CBS 117.55 TaxID=1448321 RepID=A0A317WC54_9EURO|nr:uncharacterized protein BO70DRAFT_428808 [Aspergillus heteromorphus CBS 117.55]PWY83525.1 hypothetical protein BO70DRAFT_428808 [Aspergillus heteromorphus CBS 117.55]